MSKKADDKFDRPWLLLCEGKGDEHFYQKLLKANALDEKFLVKQAGFDEQSGGRGAFGNYLNNVKDVEPFITNVKAILIISDNDLNPEKSFAEVCAEIKKAPEFPVPDAERVAAKNAKITLVILLIPMGKMGTLETVCLDAAYSKWPIKEQLDQYVASVPANGFTEVKQAKMRMQTILASTNDKDPDTGFAGHWKKDAIYHVPLNHACFDEMVAFLKSFGQLI